MNQPTTPKCPINEAVDEFVSGYELDSGEGIYSPTEHERFLLTDAINSLLNDDDSMSVIMPAILADRAHRSPTLAGSVDTPDERAKFEAWAVSDDGGWMAVALARNPEGDEFDYRDDNVQAEWRAWKARARLAPAAPEVKGKTAAQWYVAYCEASEKLKAADDCIERYKKLVAPAAPSYWKSQRKMIERAIIGLRDGWATREDAAAALEILASTHPAPSSPTAPGLPAQAVPEGGDA